MSNLEKKWQDSENKYLKEQAWPISRYRAGVWEFVEETSANTPWWSALKRAGELQETNTDWQYRLWDCREPVWKKCPQCGRENSEETWAKFGGKCPNCRDLYEKG